MYVAKVLISCAYFVKKKRWTEPAMDWTLAVAGYEERERGVCMSVSVCLCEGVCIFLSVCARVM